MTAQDWLTRAQQALQEMDVPTARLDALVLLEKATGHDRAQLLAYPEQELPGATVTELAEWLERRMQHEPLAYITGVQEFYGRPFMVTPDVLVPRPESEMIIEVLKSLSLQGGMHLADIGTGSGALAVTAALETGLPVMAIDISPEALAVAQQNITQLKTEKQVNISQGDLLSPLFGKSCEIILANLPYVPNNYPINAAAEHEPALALFAGDDGLDLYRTMFAQTTELTEQPRYIITEALPEQQKALAEVARAHDYTVVPDAGDDFIQVFTAP